MKSADTVIAAQHVDSPVKWRNSGGHAFPSTPDDAAQATKMNVDGDVKRPNALMSLPSSASGNVNASASAVSASKSSPQPQRQSFAELMSEFHNLMAELQANEQSTAVDGIAVRAPAQSAQYMSVADLHTQHSDHDHDHDRGQEQPVPTPYDELLRQERERVDREKRLGGALSVDALSQLHDEDVVNKMRGSRSQSGGLNSASTPLYLDDFRREMQKISHLYVFGGDSARSPFAASLGASAASHSSSHSATTPSHHDAKARATSADRRERQRHDRDDDDDDVMGFDHDYDVDCDDNDFDHHDDVDELRGHDSRLMNESHADADSLDGDTIARRPQSTSSSNSNSFSMRKNAVASSASSSSAAAAAATPLPPRTAMPTGSIFVTTDEKQVLRTTNEALLNALRELEREKKSLADKLRAAEVSECGGHDDDGHHRHYCHHHDGLL